MGIDANAGPLDAPVGLTEEEDKETTQGILYEILLAFPGVVHKDSLRNAPRIPYGTLESHGNYRRIAEGIP